MQHPSPGPPRVGPVAALVAWWAPASVAALAFGSFLLARNSGAAWTWRTPAVFLGGPVTLFLASPVTAFVVWSFAVATFGAAMLLSVAWLRRFRFGRIPHQAAAAAALAFGWAAYNLPRELDADRIWRFAAMLAVAPVAAFAAWRLALSPLGAAIGKLCAAAGLAAMVAFGAAALTLPSAEVKAASSPAVDRRDLVSTFPPLPSPPPRDPKGGRLFVLGIDGATWDRIDPLIAKGRLPNFERLKKEGTTARLRSIVPTISPTIWTCVATGQLPSRHGIRDFMLRRARFMPAFSLAIRNTEVRWLLSSLDLFRLTSVQSNLRRCKAIWNLATEMKLTSGVFGWWATCPAEPISGWIVADVASTPGLKDLTAKEEKVADVSDAAFHPVELRRELAPLERPVAGVTREELARFIRVDDEAWSDFLKFRNFDDDPLAVFHGTYLRDEFFVAAALKIAREQRPDLVLCYVRLTDALGHLFWEYTVPEAIAEGRDRKLVERYRDVIDNAYVWADGVVGKFLAQLGPEDTLVVMSDHGWEKEGPRAYGHSKGPDGIFAILGPGVKRGVVLDRPHVFDVAPTLLYVLGIPRGQDMAGKVLTDAFTEPRPLSAIPTWETHRIGRDGALDAFDESDREAELRAQGYIK